MAVSTPSPPASPAPPPPEGDGQGKNLTILEHLQELRGRLMWCAIALVVAMAVSFYPVTGWVMEWLKAPGEARVENFELVFTDPIEYVSTYFRVSLMIGISPGDAGVRLPAAGLRRAGPDEQGEALGIPYRLRCKRDVRGRPCFRVLYRAAAGPELPAELRWRRRDAVDLREEVRGLRDAPHGGHGPGVRDAAAW